MSLSITSTKGPKGLLHDSEIFCKNGCGFYGNSIQWGGYCSICYRQLVVNKNQTEHELNEKLKENNTSTPNSKQIWNEATNLNKFSSRKRTGEKGTSKFNLFKRSASTATVASGASTQAAGSSSYTAAATDAKSDRKYSTATVPLNGASLLIIDKSFLKTIDSNLLKDNFSQLIQSLNKQMSKFLEQFVDLLRRNELTNTKQYETVQDFYKKLYQYIQNHQSMKQYYEKISSPNGGAAASLASTAAANLINSDTLSLNSLLTTASFLTSSTSSASSMLMQNNEEIEKIQDLLMIYVESCLTNSLYDYVFPSIMSEFEDKDIKLQKRIRSLYWITHEMIGTCLDENNILYRECYEDAISFIIQMDSKRTPHDKMLSITECSKNIYKAINISSANSKLASADDYLPAFIYIVIKTNPPLLYSNMNYIARFAFEKRVLSGEHAYYFCSLNAVITHIENITASHLNMSIEEFDKYCKGLTNSNQGIKIIQTNLKILAELKDKQELLKKEAFKLQNDMNAFNECMKMKVLNVFQKNDQKYLTNIKTVNEWFKKNYKFNDCFDEGDSSDSGETENKSVDKVVVEEETAAVAVVVESESSASSSSVVTENEKCILNETINDETELLKPITSEPEASQIEAEAVAAAPTSGTNETNSDEQTVPTSSNNSEKEGGEEEKKPEE